MTRLSRLTIGTAALLVVIWGSGCTVETKSTGGTKPGTGSQKPEKKGHDHAHDHAEHGPHKGHIVEIGEEEYHAEWTHDKTGVVTVYILDKNIKEEVPIEAAEIEIVTVVADKSNTYKLAAVNASEGEQPTASRFEVEDKSLAEVLHTAGQEGIAATLHVTIGGKTYAAKFEQDKHDH